MHDEFGKTLAYLEERNLFGRLPDGWRALAATVVVPLRHFESGAQLVSVAGARFAHGTSIEQCCTFAAFDRIGNAQMLSRVGIALGNGGGDVLASAKLDWQHADHLQPLRQLIEEVMVLDDWAEGLLAVDAVDRLLYPLLYADLDEAALLGGAGAYSLVAQHFTAWFKDQRRWLDALVSAWRGDERHGGANAAVLDRIDTEWGPRAATAVAPLLAVVQQEVQA